MSAKLLQVRDLRVAYDKVEAVSGVSLEVGEGQIVTVIGPNGAGKTTLLSAIMGVLPSQGGITFGGKAQEHAEIEEMVAAGMNLVPEKRELFAEMTVEDNLMLGAFDRYRRGLRDQDQTLAEVFELFPRLQERRAQLAGTLSGGERQMLAVGRALMAKPRLLMLDEPSLGLAPRIVREVFRIVARLREMGVSILLIEQNARAALQVADYAYVLETGTVTLEGPAAEVAQDPRVVEVYLGLGHGAPA
ncbi:MULTISPECIES: ABC transporter ATP-binding protein [Achromobacter]|uniref:ABC transporter ATP-binding protein n=1 Tax=Achromobacter TaxID=222 RepID=UPI001466B8C8|nr:MULTISPECIES: ABC transporter ATP-binding protein [Achromobacter]MCG7327853.1 ABC transporter ATP-binding protein [Achromobacter sp. ACRQX]CAB3829208.1 High-affinity branched-chain amino acid transport ATP-binding protein LivF [Achromobacter animicus]CAB3892500.1 High-affinity branched-chain amino acid transport ATP-binding protein LivF [Achromobacter animicus]